MGFENLVAGAGRRLPGQPNPAPYEALARLCQDYGHAAIRKAYADWARFTQFQENLAMNGVDMIQVPRVGASAKNAADIRMTVDAVETIFTPPGGRGVRWLPGTALLTAGPSAARVRQVDGRRRHRGERQPPAGLGLLGVQVLGNPRRPGRPGSPAGPSPRPSTSTRPGSSC